MPSQNLAQKIISSHLVDGKMEPGQEIGLKVDRVLMQDATGTMACLQFEAMGIPRVKVEHAEFMLTITSSRLGLKTATITGFCRRLPKSTASIIASRAMASAIK